MKKDVISAGPICIGLCNKCDEVMTKLRTGGLYQIIGCKIQPGVVGGSVMCTCPLIPKKRKRCDY